MPTKPDIGPQTLDRYLSGELPSAEARAIGELEQREPALGAALQRMRALSPAGDVSPAAYSVKQAFEDVMARVVELSSSQSQQYRDTEIQPTLSQSSMPRNGHERNGFTRFRGQDSLSARTRWKWPAAALAGIGTVCILAWQGSLEWIIPAQPPTQGERHIHVTGAGQRAHIQLADGSSVLLAPESRLRYAEGFGQRTRDVYIDGEALVTVSHHSGAPFIVHTGDMRTRVLGTAFTVRYDTLNHLTRVVVAEGKVMLQDATLTSGDAGVVTPGRVVTVAREVNLTNELAWTAGRIVFDETLLRDVLPQIRRWYGLDMRVADVTMLNERIATVFDMDRPDDMIGKLAMLLNARASRVGDTVTFSRLSH